MSAQANLLQLYQDWRAWTDSEREAILASDWRKVKSCQEAKSQLQPLILKQTEQAQKECLQAGADKTALDKRIRSVINELIYLESCNGECITEQRAQAQAEFDGLQRSGRNLTRIQKHYAPGPRMAWESYS
jgi:hypothetical protein